MIGEETRAGVWACVLTPRGRGAVGVVRVWGERALTAAAAAFRPARGEGLETTPPGRPRLGRVGAGRGDEVVAVVVAGRPPEVEIQCHGGTAAVELVLEALGGVGVARVESAAFLRRATESPIQAAALEDLAAAPTLRTAEVLLDQAGGALDEAVERIMRAPRERIAELDRLIESGRVGVRLISGWRVVIGGRPNVGKSRLLNALVGYQRAIVDAAAGTTRDVVTATTALEGWPVELVDTAGVRPTEDRIERSGIARARREHRRADLLLKVLDRSRPLEAADHRLLAAEGNALTVVNKADLPTAWTIAEEEEAAAAGTVVTVSAGRGDGLERLSEAIARRLVPSPPEEGAGVPFRIEQVDALRAARAAAASGDEREALTALRRLVRAAETP